MARRRSRHWLTLAATALIAGALAWAFWPRPVLVDLGRALRAPMIVTIDAEAKTRVRDAYVVSAPIAGRLQRVEVEPGDPVEGGHARPGESTFELRQKRMRYPRLGGEGLERPALREPGPPDLGPDGLQCLVGGGKRHGGRTSLPGMRARTRTPESCCC